MQWQQRYLFCTGRKEVQNVSNFKLPRFTSPLRAIGGLWMAQNCDAIYQFGDRTSSRVHSRIYRCSFQLACVLPAIEWGPTGCQGCG